MSLTGGLMGGLGLIGSLGSGALEANAANNAASTQANAANYAANLQAQMGQESLANQVETQQQNTANQEPWLQTGANSLATLGYLLGITPGGTVGSGPGAATPGQTLSIPGVKGTVSLPGVTPLTGTANTNLGAMGSLMEQYPGGPFTAPTLEQARMDPGYQFALTQGEGAVNAGAAANGSLLTGGTQTALNRYAQGLADTTYNNVYNRALGTYNTNYNTWANNQANQFNRLAALSGMGQTTAQTLGSQNLASANAIGNTLMNTGAQIGQDKQNAAAATASGYMGAANAWGGALSGATGNLSQLMMMNQLMNGPAVAANPYQTLWNAQNPDVNAINPIESAPGVGGYQIPYGPTYTG